MPQPEDAYHPMIVAAARKAAESCMGPATPDHIAGHWLIFRRYWLRTTADIVAALRTPTDDVASACPAFTAAIDTIVPPKEPPSP